MSADPAPAADYVRLFSAFCAGFGESGEGWNAEYPYSDKGKDPTEDLRSYFEAWLAGQDLGDRSVGETGGLGDGS